MSTTRSKIVKYTMIMFIIVPVNKFSDQFTNSESNSPVSSFHTYHSTIFLLYIPITTRNFSLEDIFLVDLLILLAHPPVAFDFQVASVDLLIPVSIDSLVVKCFQAEAFLQLVFLSLLLYISII